MSVTYKPRLYYTLTFLTTYILWFTGAYFSFQDSDYYMLFMLPGLMAPFLISLLMIQGAPKIKSDFLDRLLNLRLIEPKVLPLLILIMPLSVIISIALSLPLGGAPQQFNFSEGFSFSTGFVPVLLLLLLAAAFEELGWRGYAFDSLLSRYDLFKASLIFGVLWSLWHFPLVFVNNSYQYEIVQESIWYGVNFFLSIIPMGVIISWFCIKNNRSIFAAILFHFIINISQEILNMSQLAKCIQTGVLIIMAAIIILYDRDIFFQGKE